jgi:hypothetical protein
MDDLALHQRDVERAGLEHWHVLGAAPGVDRLDLERRIEAAHALDEGRAIDRKAAARGRRAEADLQGLRSCQPGRQLQAAEGRRSCQQVAPTRMPLR